MVSDSSLHGKFRSVHEKIIQDHTSKGEDYESDDVKFTDSYPNLYSLWLQVNRKACRLKALLGDPYSQKQPRHESIADNARDLAAFAIWLSGWAELEMEEGNGNS